MEYITVLNNYLEYSLDDYHTVNLSFQSTSMHVLHAACSDTWICILNNCIVRSSIGRNDMVFILVYSLNPRLNFVSVFSAVPSFL